MGNFDEKSPPPFTPNCSFLLAEEKEEVDWLDIMGDITHITMEIFISKDQQKTVVMDNNDILE